MRRFTIWLLGLLAVIASVSLVQSAQAETIIEHEPTGLQMNFGAMVEGGQVFTAPASDDVLAQVTLHAGGPPGTETRLSILPWDEASGTPQGDPIYTSDPVAFDSEGWPEPLVFDLGVQVEPGASYIAILDAVVFSYRQIESGEPGFHWFSAAAESWLAPGTGLAHRMVFLQTPVITSLDPDRGPTGTEVTIKGTGFAEASSLVFGDEAAEFTVISDERIVAIAPDGPIGDSVDVRVTADGLESPTSANTLFTWTAVPSEPRAPERVDTGIS